MTIAELAAEYNLTPYGLRAYADDLLDGLKGDDAEIPAETERTLRDALAQAEGPR